MPTGWIVVIVIAVVVLVVIFWAVAAYNKLVRLRVAGDNGWSQIDVQLKRRHDLIPNFVETVKGYAAHESETLEAVIQARNQAASATSDMAHAQEKGLAENMLTQAMGRLFAVSEAYPDLKANENFMALQEELSSTENKIGFARQHYNDAVARYESQRMQFPTNILAGVFNFAEGQYFELEDKAQRQTPEVSFG